MTGANTISSLADLIKPKSEEEQAKIRAEREKKFAEIMIRLKTKYGEIAEKLTMKEAFDVEKAEQIMKECGECQGLPCKYGRKVEQSIKIMEVGTFGSEIVVCLADCRYLKMKWQQARIDRNLQNSRIPLTYQKIGFESYRVTEENQDAVRKAKWCLESEIGLFIHGLPGVGKTMLASIIANESLKKNRTVIFSKVADLLRNIRKTFQKDSKLTEQDILQDLYDCDVLIIDDMRSERGKSFAGKILFDVIDYRYNEQKQTIITSNGTLEECCNALDNPTDEESSYDGTRIYDRCKDMMKIAYIAGRSKRGNVDRNAERRFNQSRKRDCD